MDPVGSDAFTSRWSSFCSQELLLQILNAPVAAVRAGPTKTLPCTRQPADNLRNYLLNVRHRKTSRRQPKSPGWRFLRLELITQIKNQQRPGTLLREIINPVSPQTDSRSGGRGRCSRFTHLHYRAEFGDQLPDQIILISSDCSRLVSSAFCSIFR